MTFDAAPLDGRMLVLRADATTAGGTGHMMRTLALTQAWLDAGGRARWLVAEAPPTLLDRIEGEGVAIVVLDGPAGGDADAAALATTLAIDPGALAVVDGEPFGATYLAVLEGVEGRVLVIDDSADRGAYPVGFVLNQNAHADRSSYPADAPGRFLLGTDYVLLRREFVAAPPPRVVPTLARRLLVTFGGADPTGMTARTIDALRQLPGSIRRELDVLVLVGPAHPDRARIELAVADTGLGYRARVERAVTEMPSLMDWADLAITSGGSTVWELARTGCPALIVETVPVEERLVGGLRRVGLFESLGAGIGLDERALADAIAAKAEDMAWRTRMSERGRQLVDGQGARRVVDVLAGREPEHKERT